MHKKIAILGFRGVGKSTVSRLLQRKMGIPLYVMDSVIEHKEGRSITDIVNEKGWNYFRDLELQYLHAQAEVEKIIIDCGGGILEGHNGEYSKEKCDILKENFFCIYLYLPDVKLLTRLENMKNKSSRPGLQGDIKMVLAKRKPWFEQISNVMIDCDGLSPERVAEIIKEKCSH